MSRKDTIIITVLVNLGILAILFATAVIYDDDVVLDNPIEVQKSLAEASVKPLKPASEVIKPIEIALVSTEMPTDEVDHVLNDYMNSDGREVSVFDEGVHESIAPVAGTGVDTNATAMVGDVVEVTIKRGDALERIARANNTTVSAIMKENNLRSEKLSVGQVLRVPVGAKKSVASSTSAEKKESESSDKQYYIVKSGDSPWKIAKQFNVKFEDLLTLNNLNEEKARNLKIGDKIRVK